MIGGYAENKQVDTDDRLADDQSRRRRRCSRAAPAATTSRRAFCRAAYPMNAASRSGSPSLDDPRLNTSRHIVFNLSRPEKSLMLLAPLSEAAGGWGLCRDPKTQARADVFTDTRDPGYQRLLDLCRAGQRFLAQDKRFDAPGFQPAPRLGAGNETVSNPASRHAAGRDPRLLRSGASVLEIALVHASPGRNSPAPPLGQPLNNDQAGHARKSTREKLKETSNDYPSRCRQ